ncbi:hypothetical protein ES708_34834 [subsurface metagenome]
MSKPKEHLRFQYAELNKLTQQLSMMKRWGVSELDPGFQKLLGAGRAAMAKVGLRVPRTTTLVKLLIGLSPGEIKLWADAELGWMTEARARPGAPPVYKYVSDDVAEKIVKREITPELEEQLLAPDPYLGE